MARTKNRAAPKTETQYGGQRWDVGIYIRLSKEDVGRGGDDSNSVVNQRRLLSGFCAEHTGEFATVTEFSDDGCTGTDTNREGFQSLISAVMSREITCVVVKDLSRLSRNYSDAGGLIENLFVEMNVRFISLSEQIDSYKNPDSVSNLLVPITNVINDNFCYQTSKKIRQVFDFKRRNGEFIGAFAVYGYIRNPDNKHVLIVDEEAAGIVQNIFAWFLEGMSKNAIVHKLNRHGILCPSLYKKSKGLNYRNPHTSNKSLWNAKTVSGILKNRMYTGDMIQGRQRVKSYKIHKQEQVPESEWYIVENTHEPIIERAVFDKVQTLLLRDTRTAPGRQSLYLFSGFLRCADCGKAMSRSEAGGVVYYYCRTYKTQSRTACTKHSIKHEPLETAVLYALRQQMYISVNRDEVLREIDRAPLKKSQAQRLGSLITAKEKELQKIMLYKKDLYEDWKNGAITHDDYRYLSESYEHQKQSASAVLDTLNSELAELINVAGAEPPVLAEFRRSGGIGALTRELLIEFVDGIEVSEDGSIRIKLKFPDEFSGSL